MKPIKLLAMLALILPAVSHAQGWYVGLDAGSVRSDARIEESILSIGATAHSTDSTTGFRVRGGYQFRRFFAIEIAYVDLGEIKSHFDPEECAFGTPGPCPFDVRTSMSGLVGTLRGVVPIGDHWFVDARLGWGKMDIDVNEIDGAGIGDSIEDAVFHYGIGGGYRFNEHWSVTLDYTEYNMQDFGQTLGGDFGVYNLGESSMSSIGVSYRF